VVVVLSKEFISKKHSMEELQLLLERRSQGSPAKLLPVYLDITLDESRATQQEYAASGQPLQQHWARDLHELAAITAVRVQVRCAIVVTPSFVASYIRCWAVKD
jgi:hypothetical protein